MYVCMCVYIYIYIHSTELEVVALERTAAGSYNKCRIQHI